MHKNKSLREVLQEEKPLIAPVAHDALSARLIARAGFRSFAIGGSSMLAARYALPDLGIAALGEMAAGIQDILLAVDLPCIVDGDDGFGDGKSVARAMQVYQSLGVEGVILEDQLRNQKRPGADQAYGVLDATEFEQKLRAARTARSDETMLIIARTDSYGCEGLDGAMHRAERYLRSGADGIFNPGIQRIEELVSVGNAFRGVYQLIVMSEDRKSPWISPAELYSMGFSLVVYPTLVISRTAFAIDRAVTELRKLVEDNTEMPPFEYDSAQQILRESLQFSWWNGLAK